MKAGGGFFFSVRKKLSAVDSCQATHIVSSISFSINRKQCTLGLKGLTLLNIQEFWAVRLKYTNLVAINFFSVILKLLSLYIVSPLWDQ